MILDGFLLSAVHTLPVRTFGSLGFSLRVGLTNDSQIEPRFATDYRIQAKVYSAEGKEIAFHPNLGLIRPGDKKTIVVDSLADESRDHLVMFSLLPLRLLATSADGVHCSISREELHHLVSCQGHQVEYFREDGYSTGVLLAFPAYNYTKFHRDTPAVLVQAPKVFVSRDVDSYVTFINPSPVADYNQTHTIACSLTATHGGVVKAWEERVPAFRSVAMSMKTVLGGSYDDRIQFFCFSGFCDTGLLLPLIFSHNARAATLAVEHTFAPFLYGSNLSGPARREIDKQIKRSHLFEPLMQ
jgi:hypothetical protein